jgi:HEAT repeat protein
VHDSVRCLPATRLAAYTGGVSSRISVFALRIAFTSIILLSASCGTLFAQTDPTCKASVQSLLQRFLAAGEPYNDNAVDSTLSQCGDKTALSALLDALAQLNPARRPLEIIGAIEAALHSPGLAHDAGATQLIVDRFGTVRDPGARASLSYFLGMRDAAPALNRILSSDPEPYVRAAAAVSLHNCKTAPDFAALWRAAKLDPDPHVRAEAYQTLDRWGQVRTADELLAASRAQTDATNTGRFLRRRLEANKVPEEETAETLARLAEHTRSGEASGALSGIFTALQSPPEGPITLSAPPPAPPMPSGPSSATRMALIQSVPMAAAKPGKSELQRSLYRRRERITRAAIAQFAASKDMQEDAARIAIDSALAVNRCDRSGCERLDEILRATDRMDPPLALEASHDISNQVGALYFARRYRQYALRFSLAFLITMAMLIAGFARGSGRLFTIGVGWLLILAPAAALQFSAGPIMGVNVWPPPGQWPATALGMVTATLLVAVAVTLGWGRKWRVLAALIAGEVTWWLVLSLFAAYGLTLTMQHYSNDEDWLPFILAVVMPVGAPMLTLVVSATAWSVQRMLLQGTVESRS